MIANKIRYFRKLNGYTLERLSEGICSPSYLSKIEKGSTVASEQIIRLICKKLNIDPETPTDKELIMQKLEQWYVLMKKCSVDDCEKYGSDVQDLFVGEQDPQLIGLYYLMLFRFLLQKNKLAECTALLNQIEPSRFSFDSKLNYYYNRFMGLYYYKRQNYRMSEIYYLQAEKEVSVDQIGKQELADLYLQLGLVKYHLLQISLSIDYIRRALAIFDTEYIYHASAECQMLLGIAYRRLKSFELAIFHLENSLKIAETLHHSLMKGKIYHNLGYLYSDLNEHQQALKHYQLSLELLSSDHSLIPRTYYLISREYLTLGNLEEAKAWIQNGLDIVQQTNDYEYSYHLKSLYFQYINPSPEEFETLLKTTIIPYFEERNSWLYIAEYAELLAKLYIQKHYYKDACYYYSLSNEARKNINHIL